MKRLIAAFGVLFMCFLAPILSISPAYAGDEIPDTVTVTYLFDETIILSGAVYKGETVELLSYEKTKQLAKNKGIDLPEGNYYEWQSSGEKADSFVATEDAEFRYVLVAEGETRSVSYRYDPLGGTYCEEVRTYPYGAEFSYPETVNGRAIRPVFYETEEYGLADGNVFFKPTYLTEDTVVYVVLSEPATITLNGKKYSAAYAEPLEPLADTETFRFCGFYKDPDYTEEFDGIAVNGLTVYALWQRTQYALTVETKETTMKMYFPTTGGTVTKEELPAGYTWYVGDEEVSFPLTVRSDMTLEGRYEVSENNKEEQKEEKRTLKKDEWTAIIIVAAVFVIAGVVMTIRGVRLTQKKKSEQDRTKAKSQKK